MDWSLHQDPSLTHEKDRPSYSRYNFGGNVCCATRLILLMTKVRSIQRDCFYCYAYANILIFQKNQPFSEQYNSRFTKISSSGFESIFAHHWGYLHWPSRMLHSYFAVKHFVTTERYTFSHEHLPQTYTFCYDLTELFVHQLHQLQLLQGNGGMRLLYASKPS